MSPREMLPVRCVRASLGGSIEERDNAGHSSRLPYREPASPPSCSGKPLTRVLQSGPRLPGSSSWAGSLPRPWDASHTVLVVAACCFRRD
jgi:hypothetical protein